MTKEQSLFLSHLKHHLNLSDNTIKAYSQDITLFEDFLIRNNIDFRNVTRNDIRNFMVERLSKTTYRGKKESSRSLRRRISSLKKYYSYLYDEKIVSSNPFLLISSPKKHDKLPEVLYESQINKLLTENNKRTDKLKDRDQALLELMYSSGLRCSEIVNLKTTDIVFPSRYMRIIGKGNKERMVPFSENARLAMINYARFLRVELIKENKIENNYPFFFLNSKGQKLTTRGLEYIMKEIIKKTGLSLGFDLHPHVLRHTFATHLLDNGADLRMIQELMGHESIGTTSIYMHVSKEKIKNEYEKYFPKSSKKNEK